MAVRVELRRDAGRIEPVLGMWIRERQVARVHGPPDPQAIAALVDHRGRVLAHGLYSPDSRIVLRVLSLGEATPPADWLERRLAAALAARRRLGLGPTTTGYRELNSEGDGVPGLVVDRFGDWRVVQVTTAPIAARRERILAHLDALAPATSGTICIAPASAAEREGFTPGVEIHARAGDPAGPTELSWLEHGLRFTAPFGRSEPSPSSDGPAVQKTGAYHDQRDNRRRFAELLGDGDGDEPRVLDVGAHVGGFSLAAARAGARVVALDRSAPALEHVVRNATLNDLGDRVTTVRADMFARLDAPALAGPFELVAFDPPKIASSRRDLGRATGAMRMALAQLLPRLSDAGSILVCSCSHHLGWDALDRVLVEAAAGRQFARIARWGPGLDHPVAPGHAEGEYLRAALYQRR